MSIDDVVILTMSLGSVIGAAIAIRITFRRAGNARDAVFTVPVFAIIGGLIAISCGMIWLSNGPGDVKINTGFSVLVTGILVGAVIGANAQTAYPKMRRGKATVFVLTVTLLGGSIGAPLGWVACYDEVVGYSEQLSHSRMLWGAVIGSSVGLLLGLFEVARTFLRPPK